MIIQLYCMVEETGQGCRRLPQWVQNLSLDFTEWPHLGQMVLTSFDTAFSSGMVLSPVPARVWIGEEESSIGKSS